MKFLSSKSGLLGAINGKRPFVGLLLFLSTLAVLSAQTGRLEGFSADIPFEFRAGTKTLPAGSYSFVFDQSSRAVSVTGKGKDYGRLAVITRLSAHSSSQPPTIIFDKFDGIRALSEVWIPGIDGILLHLTDKEHTHEVVRTVLEVKL